MAVKEKVDVRDVILVHLESIERNLHWLSKKIHANYNTMHSVFKQKVMQLSDENLEKINEALGTKFKK